MYEARKTDFDSMDNIGYRIAAHIIFKAARRIPLRANKPCLQWVVIGQQGEGSRAFKVHWFKSVPNSREFQWIPALYPVDLEAEIAENGTKFRCFDVSNSHVDEQREMSTFW